MSELARLQMPEIEPPENRFQHLAEEEARFERVIQMMQALPAAAGLPDTAERILQLVQDQLGTPQAVLYYLFEGQVISCRGQGQNQTLPALTDAVAARVLESGLKVEFGQPAAALSLVWSCAFPLRVGPNLVGILKVENMPASTRNFEPQLTAFLRFAAQILKNEIVNCARLKALNGKLTVEAQARKAADEQLALERSEWARAAAGLPDSQTRFRALFDNLAVAIWEEDFSDVLAFFNRLRGEGVRDFRAYFEQHPEQVAACAHLIKVLDVNAETLRLLNMERPTKENWLFSDFFPGEPGPEFSAELAALAEGATRFQCEVDLGAGDAKRYFALELGLLPGYEATMARVHVSLMDISPQKRVEAALRKSEKKFREVVNVSPNAIMVVDGAKIVFANPQGLREVGLTAEEALGRDLFSIIHPADHDLIRQRMKRIEQQQRNEPLVLRVLRKDGSVYLAESVSVPVEFNDRPAALVISQDITARRAAEDALQAALEEKTALIKEIHHRVKNNMQVMISLINLQASQVSDKKIRDLFIESENRIRSMALVHEQLYHTASLSKIDFDVYLSRLAWDLYGAYNFAANIRFDVRAEAVTLPIETAIPCGLLVNELVTNAFKHAFPNGRSGTVIVTLREQAGEVMLAVADDGVGLLADLDVAHLDSLGMKLVYLLASQLKGQLEVERSAGTRFTLRFQSN